MIEIYADPFSSILEENFFHHYCSIFHTYFIKNYTLEEIPTDLGLQLNMTYSDIIYRLQWYDKENNTGYFKIETIVEEKYEK